MNLNCPHCGHDFELTTDGEFDPATDCPKCGSSVPVGPQSSIDIDFSFDLDGAFSDSGLSAEAIEAGASPEAGEAVELSDTVDLGAELAAFEESPKPPPPPGAKPAPTDDVDVEDVDVEDVDVAEDSKVEEPAPRVMGMGPPEDAPQSTDASSDDDDDLALLASLAADEVSDAPAEGDKEEEPPLVAESDLSAQEDDSESDPDEDLLASLSGEDSESDDEDSPLPTSDDLGFDEHEPEVSQLADLNLNMTGTYHRASRALHHATDVVFSKGAAPADQEAADASAAAASEQSEAEDVPFELDVGSDERSAVQSAPTQAAIDALAMSETVAAVDVLSSDDSSAIGGDALSSIEVDSQGSIEDEISALFEADALDQTSADAFESVDSSADASALLSTDEVDFDSLLDEDSLSGIKMFDEDDNPFSDTGPAAPAEVPKVDAPDSSYQSDDETNAFFVDAPAAEAEEPGASGDMDLDLNDAYEVDLPADLSQLSPPPVEPLPASPPAKASAPKPKKAGRVNVDKKQVMALAAVLTLIVGAGVVGEALGHGWFFMGLLEDPPSQPPRVTSQPHRQHPRRRPELRQRMQQLTLRKLRTSSRVSPQRRTQHLFKTQRPLTLRQLRHLNRRLPPTPRMPRQKINLYGYNFAIDIVGQVVTSGMPKLSRS